jgi:hypothetical protein
MFQYLGQAEVIYHDHVHFTVEYCGTDEKQKVLARNVRPKNFPQTHYVVERKLSLEVDQNPAENKVKMITFVAF